jgi:ABC-type sugar transport system substrate-binding protein
MRFRGFPSAPSRSVRWRSLVVLCALAAVLGLVASGCGDDDDDDGGGSTGSATSSASSADLSDKKVIYIAAPASVAPYIGARNKAVQDGIEKAGAQITIIETDLSNPAQTAQQISQAISQQPDALLVEPGSFPPTKPALTKAKAAGIPVFAINNAPPEDMADLVTTVMKQDDVKQTTSAADLLIEGLDKEGKSSGNVITIDGIHGMEATEVRADTFKSTLAEKAPDLKIIASADAGWDPAKAATVASQLLAKYANQGGVDAIYAMNGAMAVSAAKAAAQAGLPVGVDDDGIIIVGNNCDATSVKAIKDGSLYGDIAQTPTTDGATVAENVVEFLKSGEVPDQVTYPYEPVSPANVDEQTDPCTY